MAETGRQRGRKLKLNLRGALGFPLRTLSDSSTVVVCECGEDRTTEDQEEVEGVGQFMQPDKALHPWHYAGDREGFGLPY